MDYGKLFDSGVSDEAVRAWRAGGGKALGVVCCHVPPELLHAAGVLPVRLRATGCANASEAETWMSSFSCSFARSVLQYWMDGTVELDGMIASDGCIMASRIYDNASYLSGRAGDGKFFRQIGAPRKVTPRALSFYRAELADLAAGLGELTGSPVTDEKLRASIAKYNEARALVAQVYALRRAEHPVLSGTDALRLTLAATDLPVEETTALLRAFLADAGSRAPVENVRARLMVIGSALDNPDYLRVIEDKGGLVVTDALCFGQMSYLGQLPADGADPLGDLADYYLTRLVCPRMMDKHQELHEFIVRSVREYGADGVIYERMQNCECWGGENVLLERRLKAEGIPLLTVEREQQMANAAQLAIRAEAFIEMVEKER